MSTDASRSLFDVAGKVFVITGGSRGIGLMLARGVLEAGGEVLISSRKGDVVDAAVAELSALGPVSGVAADVSTAEGVATLAAAVAERHPQVDVLINNAGATWGAPIDEFPESGWDKILSTNVQGVFALTQALLPQLRAVGGVERATGVAGAEGETRVRSDGARVINIGSVDGLRVPPMENYSYSASKAAVHMLTRHLAKRLAPEGITVNAIAPGPFESKMTAFMLSDDSLREAVASTVPLGRIGEPDDVVGLTLFLSSRAGAYLTGTVIPLDGGIVGCG